MSTTFLTCYISLRDEELPDEEQEWKGLDVRQDLVEASKRLTPDSFKTWFEAFHAG